MPEASPPTMRLARSPFERFARSTPSSSLLYDGRFVLPQVSRPSIPVHPSADDDLCLHVLTRQLLYTEPAVVMRMIVVGFPCFAEAPSA
jgi:hypothetical protein